MSRTDHYLTPDLALSYSHNDDSQISLSYKMATVKPPYSHLTGSLSYVGMHEIEGRQPCAKKKSACTTYSSSACGKTSCSRPTIHAA